MTETDTSRVQRFSISENRSGLGFSNGIVPDDNGGYVSWVEYRALLARAEKAEAERDGAWNEAIEAAARYHDNFLVTKTGVDVEIIVASTEAIRALRKGEPT